MDLFGIRNDCSWKIVWATQMVMLVNWEGCCLFGIQMVITKFIYQTGDCVFGIQMVCLDYNSDVF